MAGNPRIVTEDTTFFWDGAPQRLPRGQVIDVPPDSALELAIGAHRLVPMFGAPPAALPSPATPPAPPASPVPAAPRPAASQPAPAQEKAPASKSTTEDSSDKKGGQF